MPEFLVGRLNWPPQPFPHKRLYFPPRIQAGGDTHSFPGGGGLGGANSDEGTDTMVLYILIPSLCLTPSITGLQQQPKLQLQPQLECTAATTVQLQV